jgi:hypothetical protein
MPRTLTSGDRPLADFGGGGQTVRHEAVLTAHAAGWPWRLVRRDHIEADGQAWIVSAIDDDGSHRVALYLNRAS